jgi:hypothetical protein
MADYAALISKGVAIAHQQLSSLECMVTVTKAGTTDGAGDIIPGQTFQWPALVDWKSARVRTKDGIEATSRASVQFLEPHDLDEEDTIVLPDGTTGPILDMSGFINPVTKLPFTTTVWLG